MNEESVRALRRFLGGGGEESGPGGGSFGTGELQGLLLQISLAVMMVFMIAFFLFRDAASREREEQVLELQRQKLVAAADAVRAARRARYGLSLLLPDGPGGEASAAFDPSLVLRDGRIVDIPALREAFAGGLAAAAGDFADPLRLRREWIAEVETSAGIAPEEVSAENARWLGARADADIAAAETAAREVGCGAAAALQRRWTARPEEIGDPAVAGILERFAAADEAGRLLLVTDLSDALRARSLAVVSDLAGSRAVAAFLASPSGDGAAAPSP